MPLNPQYSTGILRSNHFNFDMSWKAIAALTTLVVSAIAAPSRRVSCGDGRTASNAVVRFHRHLSSHQIPHVHTTVLHLVQRPGRHSRESVRQCLINRYFSSDQILVSMVESAVSL